MMNKIKTPLVKIYKPAKTAMQSGKSKNKWLVEYLQTESKSVSDLTGWTGSEETELQIKLKFDSKEDAIAYAKRNNLEYVVNEPNISTVKIQSYSDAIVS